MSSSLCKASVFKAYQEVINDVISNTREHFVEDGVDEAILQELKQLWETKLAATKAVDEIKEAEKVIGMNNKPSKPEIHNGSNLPKNGPPIAHQQPQIQQNLQLQPHQLPPQQLQSQQIPPQLITPQQLLNNKQMVGQVPPNNHMPQGPLGQAFPEWRRVPIQLTIPSAPGTGDGGHRILSIDVPEVFLQGHHLKSILTGQVIGTTMGLPLATACAFLQDHVNAAFLKHQQSFFSNLSNNRLRGIPQADGLADSSEEDEDKSDEGSENDIGDDAEEDEMEEGIDTGTEDEPLNSGDDVSDADGTDESFDTDNVIVCQYDKITRSKNRWKFHLKDGIMNLKGEDFVFMKANGDAEW
ncbi:hypothetical protein JTB14_030108 [Gonioctena quinquepunctata]|nr:hypothetical protein JTB14_030108 [Gonioctena quinquepunctata]